MWFVFFSPDVDLPLRQLGIKIVFRFDGRQRRHGLGYGFGCRYSGRCAGRLRGRGGGGNRRLLITLPDVGQQATKQSDQDQRDH